MHGRIDRARVPGGVGYAVGFAAGLVTTAVSVATGAPPLGVLIALSLIVCATGMLSGLRAVLGTAVACWGLDAGFVLSHRGDIVFTAATGQAAIALGIAVLAGVLGGLGRRLLANGLRDRRAVIVPIQRSAGRLAGAIASARHR